MKPLLRCCVALVMSFALITPARAATPEAAVTAIPDPDGLVAYYRELGLPLPPEDASLVRFEGPTRFTDDGKPRLMEHVGLVLKQATDKELPLLLIGAESVRADWHTTPVDARKLKAEVIEPGWGEPFETNAGLATAIQFRARGWEDLARPLLEASLAQSTGHSYSPFNQPADLPPRTALSFLAWTHWMNQMTQPGVDRGPIARRMKALLAAEPKLNTAARQSLLRSLEAALMPSTAKPGSVEAMIDALVDLDNQGGGRRSDDPDSRYLKLTLMGFDAVPGLIEHLDDPRLTCSVRVGFNNFPTSPLTVGQVVSDILQEIAADDLGSNWLVRQKGGATEAEKARQWWKEARPRGRRRTWRHMFCPRTTSAAFLI